VFREGKMTNWEGGQRVSCIMRWPEIIPAGKTSKGLACSIDLLPTFAAITSTQLSTNKIDGINILPLLKGAKQSPRNELLYYFKQNDLNAIRIGNYKLVFPHSYPTVKVAGKDGANGKAEQVITDLALYDLENDPSEKVDVKDKYPDVVKQLQATADKAREDLGDNLTKVKGANRREPGKLIN
jgi:arylsulfatase